MDLKEQFPDLTQSTIEMVSAQTNNKDQITSALKGISEQAQSMKEKDINELSESFPSIPRKKIIETLEQSNWDIEQAMVFLVSFYEEESKRNRLEEMMKDFKDIPKETIQMILDSNDGDTDATAAQLTQMLQENEKYIRENKLKNERMKIETLQSKFPELSQDLIVQVLKSYSWNVIEANQQLMNLQAEDTVKKLKPSFPSLSNEEIKEAFVFSSFDKTKTVQYLQDIVEKKKKEKEPQRKEVSLKKIDQDILNQSTILGGQLEREISEKEQKQKQLEYEEFLDKITKTLESQVRFGSRPGAAPPLIKEIDARLGKKKPVEEEEKPISSMEDKLPAPLPNLVQNDSSLQVSLKILETQVDIGDLITVGHEITSGTPTKWDWIGLFSSDKTNKEYETYQYKCEKKGKTTFKAPSVYGIYECRYFSGSYDSVAMSNRVTVGPTIKLNAIYDKEENKFKVTWNQETGKIYSKSWIGLFEKGEKSHKQYITWEYADNPKTPILFDAPIKPAEYEFRFFPYSYYPVATSNSLRIEGQDTVSVSLSKDYIYIKPDILTVDPYYDSCWAGIFLSSEKDNQKWVRYKYVADRKAELQVKIPSKKGEYEVRFFAKSTYEPFLKSEPFQIK